MFAHRRIQRVEFEGRDKTEAVLYSDELGRREERRFSDHHAQILLLCGHRNPSGELGTALQAFSAPHAPAERKRLHRKQDGTY